MRGRVPILIILLALGLLAALAYALLGGGDGGTGSDFGAPIVFIAIVVFVGLAVGLGVTRRGDEPEPPPERGEEREDRS